MGPLLLSHCSINYRRPLLAQEDIDIAVVEFEEKNGIGLENAGRIVAEWTVTELKRVGKYRIQERLLLNRVLEEQQLMLSGVIDSDQAVEIGELYGVDALVTGSVMQVGATISVTGRMINVRNGEVLKTASISTTELSELEREIVILANALCDISRNQWEVREDIARKDIGRLEVGAGLGYLWDNAGYSGLAVQTMVRYRDSWGQLWVDGVPLGGILNLEGGAAFNLGPFWALAVSYGLVSDNLVDYASSTYLNFGVIANPRSNIELGIMLGPSPGGTLWTEDNWEVELSPDWNPIANYSLWAGYQMQDDLFLFVKFAGTEIGGFQEDVPENYWHPFGDYEFITGRLSIGGLYSFAVE
ncbi:MAG TPA: hypothetical protein ENN41_04755 [Sediminispirochaeta sp.]|nr:hypothetical protein [Sediminispirochaeta sp.]